MAIRFGTDGWRAIIADEFTFPAVASLARAFADVLVRSQPARRLRVVVGFDRRFASDAFAWTAAQELAAAGLEVELADRAVPTSAVSWSVVEGSATGGLVITASHNPPLYNGVKLKGANGAAASSRLNAEVEAAVGGVDGGGANRGHVSSSNLIDPYLARLSRIVALDRLRGAGMTVVADPMFGTVAGLLPRLLGGDSTEVVEINTAHNPLFPGISAPEPVEKNLARLKKVVADGSADIGLAFDGDGDRIGVVDESGRYVSSQHVFALLARYVLEIRRERRPIVKSVTGSVMIDRLANLAGVPVTETAVGFPWIAEAMARDNASIGGEESGGFALGFHLPERDGLLAALLLLDYTIHSGMHLSELLAALDSEVGPWQYRREDVPLSREARANVEERLSAMSHPVTIAGQRVESASDLDGLKYRLADESWLLIRLSGTEPLARIYAEAHDADAVGDLLRAGRELIGT
ncbi:MAG TPA: phosphoglucomutase/phosphomannomutase family protein [Thermomicrobiaceae bacterium]|nr:phosphoglucomutase/phosphomannomutase family protein [Thermomicrobiaceae bacterium]